VLGQVLVLVVVLVLWLTGVLGGATRLSSSPRAARGVYFTEADVRISRGSPSRIGALSLTAGLGNFALSLTRGRRRS
jgi:hypothetical protein